MEFLKIIIPLVIFILSGIGYLIKRKLTLKNTCKNIDKLIEEREQHYKEELLKYEKNITDSIKLRDIIYNLLEQLVTDNKEVNRVIIFTTHNGEGTPSLIKPYRVSKLQSYSTRNTQLISKYVNLEIDDAYTNMLLSMQLNSDGVSVNTENMPESLLKLIYKKEKILFSRLFYLTTVSTGMLFISFASYEVKQFDENIIYSIKILVNELKNLYKKENERLNFLKVEKEQNDEKIKNINLKIVKYFNIKTDLLKN